MNELKCKKCGHSLFQKSDGKLKIRTNIIVFEKSNDNSFEDTEAIIKCPSCKQDNSVPIVLNTKRKESEIGHFIFEK